MPITSTSTSSLNFNAIVPKTHRNVSDTDLNQTVNNRTTWPSEQTNNSNPKANNQNITTLFPHQSEQNIWYRYNDVDHHSLEYTLADGESLQKLDREKYQGKVGDLTTFLDGLFESKMNIEIKINKALESVGLSQDQWKKISIKLEADNKVSVSGTVHD